MKFADCDSCKRAVFIGRILANPWEALEETRGRIVREGKGAATCPNCNAMAIFTHRRSKDPCPHGVVDSICIICEADKPVPRSAQKELF